MTYQICVALENSYTTEHQMNKFQGKIVQVMGSLSHLRKGLENVRNATIDEAAEVPVGKFITLVEQAVLLLGQTSFLVSYTHRFKNVTEKIRKS